MTGALVSSCKGCPHNHYYSGNAHECLKFNHSILPPNHNEQLPAWCPLPSYPQAELARLEDEVAHLQGYVQNERGHNFWITFCHLLSNYLGVKFDSLIWPLHYTLIADQKVVLVWERVTEMSVSPLSITFSWQAPSEEEAKLYRLDIPVAKNLPTHVGPIQQPELYTKRTVQVSPNESVDTWDRVNGFPLEPKAPPVAELDTKSG